MQAIEARILERYLNVTAEKHGIKAKWQAMARLKIAAAEEFTGETAALIRNSLINKAYAELYLQNPVAFKWAGLAALASQSIGEKLKLLTLEETFKQAERSIIGRKMIELLKNVGGFNYLFEITAHGNKAIYEDIYWQHLAYQAGGLAELHLIYIEGNLPDHMLLAWSMIDEGVKKNRPDLVWEGNCLVLEYEQKVVIQKILYDGKLHKTIWRLISGYHTLTGALISSPVPGKQKKFRHFFPVGNLADFKQRWKWCTDGIMPAWREYEESNPANPVKVLIQLAYQSEFVA